MCWCMSSARLQYNEYGGVNDGHNLSCVHIFNTVALILSSLQGIHRSRVICFVVAHFFCVFDVADHLLRFVAALISSAAAAAQSILEWL